MLMELNGWTLGEKCECGAGFWRDNQGIHLQCHAPDCKQLQDYIASLKSTESEQPDR